MKKLLYCFISVFAAGLVSAKGLEVEMRTATPAGAGDSLGTVRLEETKYGLVFYPNLAGLPMGLHGFHVHENGSCEPGQKDGKTVAALAAGGHYDPKNTKAHGEPWGTGHLGDLPALYVDHDGTAVNPVLAPRLRLKDARGRSLMIHVGGDNHADHPAPLGGGGARMACGVIPE